MKKSILVFLILFLGSGLLNAQQLLQESFETNGEGTRYTTNTFLTACNDYFTRMNNTPATYCVTTHPTNANGSFYWGGEDTDAATGGEGVLTLNALTVTGFALNVDVFLAVGRPNDFRLEATDYFIIEYNMDGSGWNIFGALYGNTGGNLQQDTNFNGAFNASGTEIASSNFTNVNFTIPATGNSMQVRIRLLANTGTEEIVFDNIRINGVAAATAPTVTTTTANSVSNTSANLAGNVTADGGETVTERGIVYAVTSTNANPLIAGTGVTKNTNGTGTGVFSESITGLTPGIQYSFKAYATNSVGTTYGNVLTFNTPKLDQTITFGALASKTFGDAPFALTASASSGLTTTHTSSNTAVATVSGSTVTIVGAGSTNITASQSGNTNYNAAANVIQGLTVGKANQTITFGALASKTFGDVPFALTASASSGLTTTYTSSNTSVATVSGNTVTIVGAGSTNITASQVGNTNYNAASNVVQGLTVNGILSTVSTTAASSIANTSAILAGNVTSNGGATVTERGIVYSTSDATPTIAEGATKDTNGTGTGVFSESITSLIPGTQYYFRAYAISSVGTSYGTPDTFTTTGNTQFTDSNHITYMIIGSTTTVEIISYDAALGGTSVNIPDTVINSSITYNVVSIGNGAFINKGLTNLTFTLPSNITTIGNATFRINQLATINIPNSVISIGSAAFLNNQLTSLTIPDSVTNIDSGAFSSNSLLANVIFGSGINSINDSAFGGCAITHLVIPDNVTSIGNNAFTNNQLISVTIGNSVTSIGNNAFTGNSSLNSFTSRSITPPTITTGGASDTFNAGGDRSAIDLIIPNNTSTAYTTALWTDFKSVNEVKTWIGTSTDWAIASNWSPNSIPTATDDLIIPNVTNKPIISSNTGAVANNITLDVSSSLTINDGGSLIVGGTTSGNITYTRTVDFVSGNLKGWYLMASPVVGETYDDNYVSSNDIAVNGTNSGIGIYNTSSNSWSYLQSGNNGTFNSGEGYSIKKETSNGIITFTGALSTDNSGVNALLNTTGSRFNLLGNPYTSYINSATFLTNEAAISDTKTLWVWNQTLSSNGAYEVKIIFNNFMIAPTQGFFVQANSTGGTFNFSESNQSHNITDTFQRTTNNEFKIIISDGNINNYAKVYYLDNATTGFDVGYDGEMFNGTSNPFAVYTHLVSEDQGKNFQIQSLPDSNYENMIIPVGLNVNIGKEITFTLEELNLPTDLKVFLEDKETNTFTRLDQANSTYKITTTEALNGIGRFYLHTSQNSLTVKDNITLENVSIYKANATTIRITGLQEGKANVKLFNLLGKQVLNTSFDTKGKSIKEISLPKLAAGVYVVKLQTDKGKLNKKLILE